MWCISESSKRLPLLIKRQPRIDWVGGNIRADTDWQRWESPLTGFLDKQHKLNNLWGLRDCQGLFIREYTNVNVGVSVNVAGAKKRGTKVKKELLMASSHCPRQWGSALNQKKMLCNFCSDRSRLSNVWRGAPVHNVHVILPVLYLCTYCVCMQCMPVWVHVCVSVWKHVSICLGIQNIVHLSWRHPPQEMGGERSGEKWLPCIQGCGRHGGGGKLRFFAVKPVETVKGAIRMQYFFFSYALWMLV